MKNGIKNPGVYIVQFDLFPPPPPFFEIIFFPDEQVCGGRGEAPPDGRGGRKTPPRKFLEFMTQKDAFLRPLPPFSNVIFDE